ncbi:MAG TPA: protein kinase [candidate division Zixibacteria bacterium]|nr:protein kinase [candidate division Zixibacteria bacterium]MDD4918336.1 protein kinase [candidate division Zixibacteria bacterium]MDM7974042.1 protein kinase [candidate division Zixibacteria bacterium]HPM38329.1 protein kinase [candidate division Zixibacteria bacterium]
MTLAKGHRLGPYEIEGKTGSGGMGEVYRAKDTRLDRTVAIKVLPEHSALNPEARARFEREARTVSSLNHPHICVLHDLGRQEGVDFLVMEYLEGETLEDRLRRGRLDLSEVLTIASQVAAALEAAHRKGLVHRDLKPGNIFLTEDGAKLLDFGLAKPQAEFVQGLDGETRTTPVTGAGAIVGTLLYMSPEQLEGREADARSDIFALGATLYEMITGERAFTGDSKAGLIGAIMSEQPRAIVERLPSAPPVLDRLVRKCLQKSPDRRWQTAGDLKDELDWIASAGSQAGLAAPVALQRRFRLRLAWILAAVFALTAALLGAQWLTQKTPVARTMRFRMPKPEGLARTDWPQLSPDGRYLSLLATDTSGETQIWIRPLSSPQPYPLPGTANARRPFWSPDGEFLAFFDRSSDRLMKVPVAGGQPQIICKTAGSDGTWGRNNIILFDDYRDYRSIGQVSASGGEPRLAVAPDTAAGELTATWPCFLPDGQHFIFTCGSDSLRGTDQVFLKLGDIDGGESRTLGTVESRAVFCEPEYVLYMKNGFLVAHRFNLKRLELEGEPVPLTDRVGISAGSNLGVNVAASATGILAWQTKGQAKSRMVWTDRAGVAQDTVGPPANYREIRLSPDNRRIACTIAETGVEFTRLWVADVARGSVSILTSGAGNWFDATPLWFSDSRSLVYLSVSATDLTASLCRQLISRSEASVLRQSTGDGLLPLGWTASGNLIVGAIPLSAVSTDTAWRLVAIDPEDTGRLDTLLTGGDAGVLYDVSPDGRYLLVGMTSGVESGLHVRDLLQPDNAWLLPGSGTAARWSPAGDEIFYFEGDNLVALDIDLRGGFAFGAPDTLFRRHLVAGRTTLRGYDVSYDGRRFLFVAPVGPEEQEPNEIEIVLNWNAELKRK